MGYEKRTKVVPYQCDYYCDHDGCSEKMEFNGNALMSNPPQYKHVCPKCGKIENLTQQYPTIKWVPEEEENHDE